MRDRLLTDDNATPSPGAPRGEDSELLRMREALHPWYGPCDGMGKDGACAECLAHYRHEPGRHECVERLIVISAAYSDLWRAVHRVRQSNLPKGHTAAIQLQAALGPPHGPSSRGGQIPEGWNG